MKKKIIILTSIFILISICMISGVTYNFDQAIYHFFITNQPPIVTKMFNLISTMGSTEAIIIITLGLIFLLNTNHKRVFALANTALSALIIFISKNIFTRSRPYIGSLILNSYSFPSGHSLIATTYYGYLIYLLNKSDYHPITKKIGTISLSSLIFLIALSRLVLGVHYLTDVLAGITLGLLILSVTIYYYEKTKEKNIKEKPILRTLSYGLNGITYTLSHERNMVIHFLIMILVIIAGITFKISFNEWLVCFLLFALVLSLELANTAIENVVDLVTSEKNSKAKIAKDASAGAVLISAIFASIIGLSIFLPKLINLYLGKL